MKIPNNNIQLKFVRFSWLFMFVTLFAYGAHVEKKVISTSAATKSQNVQQEQTSKVAPKVRANQKRAKTEPTQKPTPISNTENGPRESGEEQVQ